MLNYSAVLLLLLFISCNSVNQSTVVNNAEELQSAISEAEPGDDIVMANGEWSDIQIRLVGHGTENKPITVRAETPGKVIIQGESDLKIGGEYIIVDGLHFKNGRTPSDAVVEFRINNETIANHCILTNCVIEDYNQLKRSHEDLWVQFWGRHNQLKNSYLAGKSNRGPTVRINIRGNESIKNYHKIINNHFGPRPPKGGPSAETIQLGDSQTSMSPSNTLVANNLFDRCNGEVEIISSKTNFNEFRNNVFYKSEGSLVTRHGNYCTVDGNFFIGDDQSEHVGGIRLIGTGHWVTNNYFYNLKGQNFRSPLAVMNGIPRSPLNRYIQVTDVVVAYNTWVNCKSPWHFGVGSNVDQKDVLPASEIRSAAPIRTTVANNFIYNTEPDGDPLVAHDKIDGIEFHNNVINNQGGRYAYTEELKASDVSMVKLAADIYIPNEEIKEFEVYNGFDFQNITHDVFGNSRKENNVVGAISNLESGDPGILDQTKYGPDWYETIREDEQGSVISVGDNVQDLIAKIAEAKDGDLLVLGGLEYSIVEPLIINKKLTIRSDNEVAKIVYNGSSDTPLFELHPRADLVLENVDLKGQNSQYAFACLKDNMSSLYNLEVRDSEISNFDYVLKAYKYSMSDSISFINTNIENCANGIELSEERDDRGEYNAEYLIIDRCHFRNIGSNVIDYYRGGYDESTIGGTLVVTNSTFENCGAQEKNGILLNSYGIINVNISNNTFLNNRVKLVALLWGAKNNSHANNEIKNSGRILVEENLKLNLMY